MSVMLEIPDGDPWWLSPYVWTVPGENPEGTSGSPTAGVNCYVWARVTNNGSSRVENATVRFYWANPSLGFDRTTATMIGTAFVTLEEGASSDVLCLVPWVPQYVNEGHECVLAEAFHPSLDPLPLSAEFNVATDRHVAQRNLSVLRAESGSFSFAFEVHNPSRASRTFRIEAKQNVLDAAFPLLEQLGQDVKFSAEGELESLGFVMTPCPDWKRSDLIEPSISELHVPAHGRAGLTLVGRLNEGSALLHIEQWTDDVIVGGLSVLVVSNGAFSSKEVG